MAGAGKDQVHNIEQQVPKFIREFRERTGQAGKEKVDINSKRKPIEPSNEDSDEEDRPDKLVEEAPVICVGKGVSAEEAYSFTKEKFGDDVIKKSELKRKHEVEEEEVEEKTDGKFVFKKPTKERVGNDKKKSSSKTKGKSDLPKVKNKTL